MWDNLRADTRRLREFKTKRFPWYVLESLLFENGYQAVVLHRAASWFKRHRIPLLGPAIARLALFLTGVDIAPGARLGPGLLIAHGTGLVIGDRVKIGRDSILLHQVTLGASHRDTREAMPEIGDRVFIAAGARVIGGIRIGHDVFLGANTVIVRDVPDGTRVILRQELEMRPAAGHESGDER